MLRLRELTEDERKTIERLVPARSTPVGKRTRARIIWLASQGPSAPEMAKPLGVGPDMVPCGSSASMNKACSGWKKPHAPVGPPPPRQRQVSIVIQTALSKPQDMGEDDAMWTMDRVVEHLQRVTGMRMKRSRKSRDVQCSQPQLAPRGDVVGLAGRSRLRQKKGAVETVYTAPPEHSVSVCLDQMGPVGVKSYPGKQLMDPTATESHPASRARQEIDYGRREKAGDVFAALQPKTGEVLTATSPHRRLVNWIDFLKPGGGMDPQRRGAHLCCGGYLSDAPSGRRAALPSGLSPLGVRLPADLRRLCERD